MIFPDENPPNLLRKTMACDWLRNRMQKLKIPNHRVSVADDSPSAYVIAVPPPLVPGRSVVQR